MGKKGSWFSSVKKALSPSSKEKKAKNSDNSKQKWPATEMPSASNNPIPEPIEVSNLPLPHVENVNFTEVDDEQRTRDYPVEVPPHAFVEVAQPSKVTRFIGKSEEEVAAIKIQTTFRGYMARRALRALKGLVRLKTLVDGPTVKRQTANTMKCMQNLSRVHAQIQSRRMRMAEENRTLQRQLLQKRAKELESLKIGEEWDQSLQSKEQIEASLLQKYEAAMRRERALAYSYTHQQTWKKSARPMNLLFMDPTNPHWGWSWLERWMASTQPFEKTEKDLNSDSSSIKTAGVGEITKSYARHQLNAETPPSPARQKPSSRQSPATPKIASRKVNPLSPMGSMVSQDDDSRSMYSVVSERNRRHTIGGGSSVRDDESLASSPSVPSYMAPTRSAKGKMKLPSPLGAENSNESEKGSSVPVKKRLSFPPSPAKPRRLSGPPRVETSTVVESGGNGVLIS